MNDKPSLRAEFLARRNALPAAEREAIGLAIARHAQDIFSPDRRVLAGYAAMKNEWPVWDILHQAGARGIATALPVMEPGGRCLSFRRWNARDTLVKNLSGVLEPAAASDTLRPDAVLVPLLAFDSRGYRLGYGGGYYDATLAHLRAQGNVLAIGIAADCQRAQALPVQAHDEKLDLIVTESGIIRP